MAGKVTAGLAESNGSRVNDLRADCMYTGISSGQRLVTSMESFLVLKIVTRTAYNSYIPTDYRYTFTLLAIPDWFH